MASTLFTNQITHLAQSDTLLRKVYVGTFAADKVDRYSNVMTANGRDKYPKFIANSDNSNQPGEHWIAFVALSGTSLEIFDSYGRRTIDYSDNLYRFMRGFHRIKQFQSMFSETCGYFCLFYLFYRAKGEKMNKVLGHLNKRNHLANDLLVVRAVKRKMGCKLYKVAPEGHMNIKQHRASFSNRITDLEDFEISWDFASPTDMATPSSITSINIKFRDPSRVIVAGPSCCGKTTFLKKLLMDKQKLPKNC